MGGDGVKLGAELCARGLHSASLPPTAHVCMWPASVSLMCAGEKLCWRQCAVFWCSGAAEGSGAAARDGGTARP